jgi:hypothetical protein
MRQMPGRMEFRGAFKALDREGTNYSIDVFQLMHDGSQGQPGGIVLYRTPVGQPVKRIRKGVYEILDSRITLQIVDTNRR